MSRRALPRVAAAVALFALLPLAACDREDKADVDRTLDELGEKAEQAWREAEPEIKEGVRDAGEVVGKGIEAAGEAMQRGGEELQNEVRDTTDSTLPDTVPGDTAVLR